MEKSSEKLFIIDAMSMIYRAYFALNRNPIVNSKGLNTSAILGFSNILTDLLSNEKPSHIAVAFDSAAPTFRHEEFIDYKAQREAMPEDIAKALPYIFQILEKLHISVFRIDGFEADDIIGTLAKKVAKQGVHVYMVTTDKDFGQLVGERIYIYKPGKQGKNAEILGEKEICEKYEISTPAQLIDILGLWGDASDNIPGIPGIGEVKAKKLVSQFGSVESMIADSDKIENKRIRELVETYGDQAVFSKNLATIETEVPLKFTLEKLKWQAPDPAPAMDLFRELEFRTFSRRFMETFYKDKIQSKTDKNGVQGSLFESHESPSYSGSGAFEKFDSKKVHYNLVKNTDEFSLLMKKLIEAPNFAFDTETTGLNPFQHEIIGISFCLKEREAFYLPLDGDLFSMSEVQPFLVQVFDNEESLKIAHNLKFDLRMLKKSGIIIKGPVFDTMIANYLLEPEGRHNLDYLCETRLSYKTISFEDLIPMKNPGPEEIRKIPTEDMSDYSCEDADMTFRLFQILDKQLRQSGMYDLFCHVEMPLVEVLAHMEEEGIAINTKELSLFSEKLGKKLDVVEKEIFDLAGVSFNLSSPKQLGEVIFEKLKISDKPPKTKTKQYATGEEVLQKFSGSHPVIPLILEHRMLTKLKSTYVDALPKYIEPSTGRLHTMFNQTVTATGRLSSSNPNIQNIPVRTELGQEIRRAFISGGKDFTIVSADYSQIELRIIAAMSNEKTMIEDFEKGLDIHAATAARIYNISPDMVTSTHRRNAKTVNFGIIYGISGFGLAERLGISRKESDELISEYFKKYPGVKKFMNLTIENAKKMGFVETIKGRKRFISNINSSNAFVRGFAERTAINAPVQGSAADIIKIAMIKIHRRMKEIAMKSRMILQIHDELVFDVYKPELEEISNLIIKEMKSAFDLAVPVDVELNHGDNWLDAH
jgi:DNA polymerase I